MPNWCENNLSITGPIEEMRKFMDAITIEKSPEFIDGKYELLNRLYPTPSDLEIGDASFGKDTPEQIANKEKHGYADWYDWRIDKWGTKWPESSLSIGQQYSEYPETNFAIVAFNYETAWGPAIEAFNKISKDYPGLLFCLYYEEPGMGFCGRNIWANGEMKESEESELISKYFDEEYLYNQYIENNK